jgi:glutamate-ammonia-ligase adenylyltransferase
MATRTAGSWKRIKAGTGQVAQRLNALLFAKGLTQEEVGVLLTPYGIRDPKRADAALQAIAGEPRARAILATFLGEILDGVARTADPDQALTHWERFLEAGLNRVQLFGYLSEFPRLVHLLCAMFGNSPAMAQTLIRDPFLVYWLAEEGVLAVQPSRKELEQEVRAALAAVTATELKLEALRRFKRRAMLRIGLRDIQRFAGVQETTAALSDLASVLVQAAYETVEASLQARYGKPTHRDSKNKPVTTGFAVIGMGKLGGGELNFSSDVDLIYVYGSDEGETHPSHQPSAIGHQRSISNEEYFEYLARDLTKVLTEVTQEGSVFRVDLRLRAEGSVGRLARSLAEYEQYYKVRGQVWERLALLKAWPVAGDQSVGKAFLRLVKPFVLGAKQGPSGLKGATEVLDQVKAVKDMIDEKMSRRGHETRNVKLGTGGIREIEFTVQALQVLCGRRVPAILDRSTLGGLARLRRLRFLSKEQEEALARAYLFLRDVEHKLQMVHDLQTHALPEEEEELTRCAIRLGYGGRNREASRAAFVKACRQHTTLVNGAFRDLFAAPAKSRLLKDALKKISR